MADSVRGFKLTIFSCLWIHICSHIQFDEYPRITVCDSENANLIWKYTSNESISSVQWHKQGSPDVLMADIFFGFTAQGAYTSRVTQATALGNAAITLSSVTAADNGTYKCSVNTNIVENRGYLIVAEAPSGLSYFNKTANSLTCNPPQNEGTPKVRTVLKKDNGEILNYLTVQSSGTYHCCIIGDAVKCLASTSNTSVEICVNETLNAETTTVTNVETTSSSQTTTELITTSTEPQTSPKGETTDSVTSTTEAKTTRSYSETTTKPLTSNLPEGGQTTIKSTTTLEAESSSSSTNTVYTSTTKPSGSPLAGEEIIIITVCSVVGFIIILFIVIIVMFAMYKRPKTPIEKHHKQEHTDKFHKQQEKKDKPVKSFDDFHALENRNKYERENERHITHFKYSNKRKKTTSSYQHPRGYDHNKYNNRNTISTYYPRMYGGSHNYGFDWETSPYEQNYQYYTGSTPGSSYYDQQKHQEKCLGGHHDRSLGGHHHGRSSERHHGRSSERHHGRYQRTHYQSYPAASYHYFSSDLY